MERTLVSWNLPNMITIPLRAAGGYLVFLLIRQVMLRSGLGTLPGGG